MKSVRGELLYVGKAKNLRSRLGSYARASVDNSSRKTLRLLQLVRSIEWEVHADEQKALLRENGLLRSLAPPFNVVNTSPHTYLFARLRFEADGIRFHLAMSQDADYPEIYGAFKGVGLTYQAQKALFRLLCISFHECRNGFELPGQLTNRRKLDHYLFRFPDSCDHSRRLELFRNIRRFYNGTSKKMLAQLIDALLKRSELASFVNRLIQEDLEILLQFYEHGSGRNRKLKRALGIRSHLIAQDQLDDLLVLVRPNPT